MENDVGRHVQLLAHALAQVFEHLVQGRVNGTGRTALQGLFKFLVFKVLVLNNLKRFGLLQEGFSFGCHFEHAIIIHILLQIASDLCLADNGVPQFLFRIVANTEIFQFLVVVGKDLLGFSAHNNIYNVVILEFLFRSKDNV